MKYFVTGATGFIGGYLTDALLQRGHEVVALVRTPAKAADLAAKGVQLHPGDIVDKASMRAGMDGVDGVFHVAAWYKIGEKSDMATRINVEGTRNVLELMQELNIPKGVYTSTVGVFGDTHGEMATESYYANLLEKSTASPYEKTKWRAHYEVALPMMQAGLPLVIVQPGLVYGPGDTSSVQDSIDQYLTRKLPMMPAETSFVWAHVTDIVTGHILAMEKGQAGESYIIAGEKATFAEALKLAEELTGIPAPMTAPSWVFGMLTAIMRVVHAVVPVTGQYHPDALHVLTGVTFLGDNRKARHELGYQPRPLREGLAETLRVRMAELGLSTS